MPTSKIDSSFSKNSSYLSKMANLKEVNKELRQKNSQLTKDHKRFLKVCDNIKAKHNYSSDTNFSQKVINLHPRSFSAIRTLERMVSTNLIYLAYQRHPEDVDVFWILTGDKEDTKAEKSSE